LNELIKIGNQEIELKEFKGQRVVTFKDIDLVHERPEGTAGRNFRENKERFVDGEDYFFVRPNDIQADEIRRAEINNFGTYLITEQGYLMLVKSFTDDLAWKVQRQLVNTYFRSKKPLSAIEMMELQFQAIKEVDSKVDTVNKDLQAFKTDMPLLALECDRITAAVRSEGVKCLGGKDSEAYQDRSLRGRVYSDIYGQLKREFGVMSYKAIKRNQTNAAVRIIKGYELPMALEDEIKDTNAQMAIW